MVAPAPTLLELHQSRRQSSVRARPETGEGCGEEVEMSVTELRDSVAKLLESLTNDDTW